MALTPAQRAVAVKRGLLKPVAPAKPPKNAPGVTDLASAVAWSKAHGNQTAGPYTAPKGDLGGPQVAIGSAPGASPSDPGYKPPAPLPNTSYDDSIYEGQKSDILGNQSNLKGSLINKATGLMQDYGINGPAFNPDGYDPNNPGSYSIDPNVDVTNPFSRAALLKHSYQAQSRGDGNGMAARGQLYSGAYQNAQDTDTRNYQGGLDSLLKNFGQNISGLYGQWVAGESTASGQLLDAQAAGIYRHANDPVPTSSLPVVRPGGKSASASAWSGSPYTAAQWAKKINYTGPAIKNGQTLTDLFNSPYFKTHILTNKGWVKKK